MDIRPLYMNAIITGASAGIGRELAFLLAKKGYHVILVARSADKLAAIKDQIFSEGGSADYYPIDLVDQAAIDGLIRQLQEQYRSIDLLINNAGIGWYGNFNEIPWSVAENLILLNMNALAKLTHAFIDDMKQKKHGQVINISSIVGDLPVQGVAFYAASKGFVNNFTRSVSREMTGSGVLVTLVKLGPVRSDFYSHSEKTNGHHIPGEAFAISTGRVAQEICNFIGSRRKVVIIPGYYFFFPLVEQLFGWIIDLIGPVILKVKPEIKKS